MQKGRGSESAASPMSLVGIEGANTGRELRRPDSFQLVLGKRVEPVLLLIYAHSRDSFFTPVRPRGRLCALSMGCHTYVLLRMQFYRVALAYRVCAL